jgi:8-oxo-dGTP diphosphatase
MRVPEGLFAILKEILRHLLRRPVVGVSAFATTPDGRVLLIRRGDTGDWALPGGTLEWGEDLRSGIRRELAEEAGVSEVELGALLGVFAAPERDPRFHAVTVLVGARIAPPTAPPLNPAEILEVRLFEPDALPPSLSHGNGAMLAAALEGRVVWE